MPKSSKVQFENPAPHVDEEDKKTLAAIDEGIRDAKSGRTLPAEAVRKLVPKWTTKSSTRKER